MTCPKCNTEVQPGWVACPAGGEQLPQKVSCAKCGKELEPSWQACPYCGQAAAGSTMSAQDVVANEFHQTQITDERSAGGANVAGGIHVNVGSTRDAGAAEVEYEEHVMTVLKAGGELDSVRDLLENRRRDLGVPLRVADDIEAACLRRLGRPVPSAEDDAAELPPGLEGASQETDPESGLPLEVTRAKDGAPMVLVPGGQFAMGASPAEALTDVDQFGDDYADFEPGEDQGFHYKDEVPQHAVHVDAFYVSTLAVTNEQYRRFMAETGHHEANLMDDEDFNGPQQPVVGVAWTDADAYCQWAGAQLPTEAQWEKAARGTDRRLYPWGNERPQARHACYTIEEEPELTGAEPVGSYPMGASPYGVLDMAGNVWEWCQDWFGRDVYRQGQSRNPEGLPSGDMRVVRGGSWFGGPQFLRAAFRNRKPPDFMHWDYGFRCVVGVR